MPQPAGMIRSLDYVIEKLHGVEECPQRGINWTFSTIHFELNWRLGTFIHPYAKEDWR
jgi:hypothetical protein